MLGSSSSRSTSVGAKQGGGCAADATCACDAGWSGEMCELGTCPNDCDGHGACQPDGSLEVSAVPDELGNTIPDFSQVGYRQGEAPPHVELTPRTRELLVEKL